MESLPLDELVMLIAVMCAYAVASAAAFCQLRGGVRKYGRIVRPAVSAGVCLAAVLLGARGVRIGALPLTGLFESMILLSVVFGAMYLLLGAIIKEAWFGGVMVWLASLIVILAGLAAGPSQRPRQVAMAPWAVFHGVSMVLAAGSLTFAATNAVLYLLATRRLKRRRVTQVVGKFPNIGKLQRMNILALELSAVLSALGLAGGIGMAILDAERLGLASSQWFTDSKVLTVAMLLVVLIAAVVLDSTSVLKAGGTACVTLVAFVLLLWAMVGSSIVCGTVHDFKGTRLDRPEAGGVR